MKNLNKYLNNKILIKYCKYYVIYISILEQYKDLDLLNYIDTTTK